MMALQIQPQYLRAAEWQALALREELQYEALELTAPPLLGADSDARGRCSAFYRNSGRCSSLHGAFIDVNPASGDPAMRSLSQRRCRESCELAMALGAAHVVFHSSCFPFLRGTYLDSWAASGAAFYNQLAEEFPTLSIHIENSPDIDPDPIASLMSRCSDRIGVCLDIGHANYSGTPLDVWLDRLSSRINYLHLSDNNGKFDDHLPLGDGNADWAAADRFWRSLCREIPVTLEVGGIDGVERSLAYLKTHHYFGLGDGT